MKKKIKEFKNDLFLSKYLLKNINKFKVSKHKVDEFKVSLNLNSISLTKKSKPKFPF